MSQQSQLDFVEKIKNRNENCTRASYFNLQRRGNKKSFSCGLTTLKGLTKTLKSGKYLSLDIGKESTYLRFVYVTNLTEKHFKSLVVS